MDTQNQNFFELSIGYKELKVCNNNVCILWLFFWKKKYWRKYLKWNIYIIVTVTLSGIAFEKKKLGVTLKYDKQDVIDFTKISKLTMCKASEAWGIDVLKNQVWKVKFKNSNSWLKIECITYSNLLTVAKSGPVLEKLMSPKNDVFSHFQSAH